MNVEDMRVQIDRAVDLLQVIIEDAEEEFVNSGVSGIIAARGELICSSLDILRCLLTSIRKQAREEIQP